MSDMVEKVARAIARQSTREESWREWVAEARAAIAAMREPTDRETVEQEIINWLQGIAEHTDNQHDHDLIMSLAASVARQEHLPA